MKYLAIDIFSGLGGLTVGLKDAGFKVVAALDNNLKAISTYKLNHPEVKVINNDIRKVESNILSDILKGKTLHLLAGCPPCQGFSSVRRLNRVQPVEDERNNLLLEYLRFVRELNPLTIMMENVPGLATYSLFEYFIKELTILGYKPKVDILNVKDYGVPQRRKRLVVLGSKLSNIDFAPIINKKVTVKEAIGKLIPDELKFDKCFNMKIEHTARIKEMISLIPKNGGSRKDLPDDYILTCHKKENVGFNDIYGRLRWDDYSTTITGGCLNPSKGRFLHPEEDRCINAREAALLQTFPIDYKFPESLSKTELALQIGNALPPKFSYFQSINIKTHLDKYLE